MASRVHHISCVFATLLATMAVTSFALPITFCGFVQSARVPHILHAVFATKYFASQFPNLNVNIRYVGMYETPASTPRGTTLAFAANGTGCDIVIGPGTSASVQAVNALITSMWVSPSASADELSDRVNYPLYNRVVPPDTQAELNTFSLMVQLGWTTASLLCIDNTYGQSAAAAIAAGLRQAGGRLYASDCVPANADRTAIGKRVQLALNSPSRILVVSAQSADTIAVNMSIAINEVDVNRKLIVIYTRAFCTSGNLGWQLVPGAFCLPWGVDQTLFTPFLNAYKLRDTSAEAAAFRVLGYPLVAADVFSTSATAVLAADAARIALQAMDSYIGQFGRKPPSSTVATAWLRNQTVVDGFSGLVSFPNGNRQVISQQVLNSAANGTVNVVGSAAGGNITFTASSLYVLSQMTPLSNIPPAVDPVIVAPEEKPLWIIAAVLVPVVIIAAIVGAIFAQRAHRNALRPMDGTKAFGVMFIGVHNNADIRDCGDEAAAECFATLGKFVRSATRSTGCFEARRVDDATVMVVAKTPEALIACIDNVMKSVKDATWAKRRNMLGESKRDAADDRSSSRSHKSKYMKQSGQQSARPSARASTRHSSVKRPGLSSVPASTIEETMKPRLQVGIHFGFGSIDVDEDQGAVSYHGGVVDQAAKVCDIAVASQVLVTSNVKEALEDSAATSGVEINGRLQSLNTEAESVEGLHTFIPTWWPEERVRLLEMQIQHVSKQPRTEVGGGITAALQQATSGVCQRNVAVIVIDVPWLVDAATTAEQHLKASDILHEVEEIVMKNRGELHAVEEGRIVATVNATLPASMPAGRAAHISLDVDAYLRSVDVEFNIGIATGLALVGRTSSNHAAVCLGRVAANARLMQQLGRSVGVRVAAADFAYDDITVSTVVLTVDMFALPGRRVPTRLLALLQTKDATSEGEWMYNLGLDNLSLATNEKLWTSAKGGVAIDHEHLESFAMLASAPVVGPAKAVIEAALARSLDGLRRVRMTADASEAGAMRYASSNTRTVLSKAIDVSLPVAAE